MTQTTQSASLDDRQHKPRKTKIHSILGDPEHRIILRVLADADGSVSLKELTRATLRDQEYDADVSVSILEGLMLDIYLPVLDSTGAIETDAGYNRIGPGEHHEAYLQMAEAVDEVYEQHFGGI
ncbi:hypothetical protein [Halorussus litoreus]|uniref:hypothetical protein n=1 Tax=Halorussus litoreus TaxID=1710536 RepID=UPI0013003504|nr:hypothetical protein [Halorussus litoreus]